MPRRVVEQILAGQLPHNRPTPKANVQTKLSAPQSPIEETPKAIAARLRPVIADYYKRMEKLDQKKPARRVTSPPMKKRYESKRAQKAERNDRKKVARSLSLA